MPMTMTEKSLTRASGRAGEWRLGVGVDIFTTSVNGIGERAGNAASGSAAAPLPLRSGASGFKYQKLRSWL